MKKYLLLLSIFLFGCLPGSALWGAPLDGNPISTETSLPLPAANSTSTALPTPTPTATVTPAPTSPVDAIQRVLIVTFDGLRPDAIARAPMDNLTAFMNSSAFTLNAQTVFPSTTLPAHSSMLTGMCVSRHHVIWDDYIPENGFARGVDLFDLAHAAGLRTVMIVGKEKLRQITEPQSTDVFEAYDFTARPLKDFEMAEPLIVRRAIEEIEMDFDLMFIHFPSGDYIGHKKGWMSKTQLSMLRDEDDYFGDLLRALDENGLRESTLVIVTSDHGGHETTHGFNVPEDLTIPWIISGPGVQPMELTTDVQLMDTAVTVAYALHLEIPAEWQGVPVTEVFGLPIRESAAVCQ
jgi:hypothetical protein